MLYLCKSAATGYLTLLCFISCMHHLYSEEAVPVVDDTLGEQVKNLRSYEIINPVEFSSAHLKNDSLKKKYFQINAFGNAYEIVIETLYEPQSDGVQIEYVGRNNSVQGKLFKDTGCIYNGPSGTNKSLNLVLNHCGGLEGFIQTNHETLFIEPLKNFSPLKPFHRKHIVYRSTDVIRPKFGQEDNEEREAVDTPPISSYDNSTSRRRVKRSGFESFLTVINRSKRRIQLYYIDSFKREIPFIMILVNERRGVNTFEGTTWLAKDDKTNKQFLINGKEKYITIRNSHSKRAQLVITRPAGMTFEGTEENNKVSGSQHYIEVLVVADKSVVDFHGKGKVEKYLMTMMNIAAYVLKDKSLGVNVNFEVVKVVLLETDEESFTVYTKSPTKTLVSACNYISSLNNGDEKHPDHFDIGIVITRKDFGPSGYAQLYSMCSKKRSCALVQDEGLTSSFIVAHETAHLLGLDHDGEGESSECLSEGSRGSVMAPLIVARYDRFHWSRCSREVIRENLEYFECLRNYPKDKVKNRNKQLPGALYTLDEQCQFNFDKSSSKCTAFSFDPCRVLWCQGDTDRKCITMRGPALDGSVCARNKHCRKGECVETDNHTRQEEKKVVVVDGKWSSWTTWSRCSQSCGIGLRYRQRFCNDPEPGPGGNKCYGDSNEKDICSTRTCPISKSAETLLMEQCQNDKGWTRYFDRDFDNRLKQPRNNLNCTFEDGMCNWEDDGKNSNMPWLLHEGATPSFRTGPDGDHTTADGKGKYVYMEASSTNENSIYEGNVARLVSPIVQVPRVCFGMYYHMWGEDMGSLRINLIFSNGTKQNKWSTSENKNNRWLQLQLSISSVVSYKIVIEAVRGAHWAGDIAIDDIFIYSGVCPSDIQGANKCKISCRSRSARSFKMNINVTDGIECGDQRSNDICLKGECVGFGCDNKFGSKLKFDDCGVCGGNGSLCSRRTGRKIVALRQDYEVLVTLHKGSTFINLTELSPRAHYFGVRKRSTESVYLSTKYEDYYNIEGATFHFKKGESGQQEIFSKGPISNDLEVIVYSFQHTRRNPVTLAYEYFELSKGGRTYRYKTDGWQSCSQTCGAGKQKSIVRCIRDDEEEVEESFCSHLQKPLRIRVCNLRPCERNFIWTVRSWNICSKTCGGGEQQRRVLCVRKSDGALAPERYCRTAIPARTRVCNKNACLKQYTWKTREWNSCTATCGGGFKTRVVNCVEEGTELVAQESRCKQTKPDTVEPCAMDECETFVWKINHVGRCSVSCGGGHKLRIINCVKESNHDVIVGNNYCDGPSPLRILKCNEQICPEYVWSIGERSPCSVTCGDGVVTRSVKCIEKVSRNIVTPSNCKQTKPDDILKCNERQCTRHNVAYGEWERCNAMCGIGVQRRQVYCMAEDRKTFVDLKYCQGKEKMATRSCQLDRCSKPDDLNCDFESQDTCNWKTIEDDDFNWTVARSTPSLNTGPLTDHTKRIGYFAYIEASRPRRKGDRSILASPYLRTVKGCLVFWYHMMGSTVGRLRLYLSSNASSEVVFEKQGHISRRWVLQKIELNSSTVSFAKSGYQFIFEGTVGNGAYGDIALDDIKFYDTPCNQSNIIHNPIVQNCREISPLCKHRLKKKYCLQSSAYGMLCCKTCAEFMVKNK